ncbi:MAG TPA: HD domain-containing protein [Miltoncostaeaceae bacterium]|nr:HD domain-containing protein [Miltoncostaeaceae bacterium]
MSRVARAAAYAARLHDGQTRPGTAAPKMAHLLGVTANVLEDAGRHDAVDEEEAVAALLHDAAEDGGGRERLDDIRRRFGHRVAEIVEALSDSLDHEPPPWRVRKEAYLRSLHGEERPSVLRVSLADKLDNIRAIVAAHLIHGDAFWDRFHPRDDTLWYYGTLADLFSEKAPGPMAEELQSSVARLRGGS